MKKKFILFLFTVTFLFCLTSCGGKKETTAQTESETQAEVTKKAETKKETEETLAEGQMYRRTGRAGDRKQTSLCHYDQQYRGCHTSERYQSG